MEHAAVHARPYPRAARHHDYLGRAHHGRADAGRGPLRRARPRRGHRRRASPSRSLTTRRVIEVYLGTDAQDVQATVAARTHLMLVLTNLSAGYGSFRALFDVSLEVRAGETVAVIGPNGAGKTTLAARHLSFDRPQRGGDEHGRQAAQPGAVARSHRPRHRARTGEPTAVSAPHCRGQSADGRLCPIGARAVRRASRARLSTVPAHAGAAPASGRNAIGRRAADVRHRPCAHVAAQDCCCSTSPRPASRR